MKLVRVLARPCLFRPSDLVIARHAHFLRVMAAGMVRAAQHLVLSSILVVILKLFLVGGEIVVRGLILY